MFIQRLRTHVVRYAPMIGLIVVCVVAPACDALRIHNSAGQPVGLLIDAENSDGVLNDHAVVTAQSEIAITNYHPSGTSNEVTGFTNDRPPKHVTTPWTSQRDTFDVIFAPLLRIPVTVWIIKGPYDQQRLHAIEACIRTSAIWHAERMGVEFDPFEIRDATGDPEAAAHYAFPNGDVGDSVWKPLRDDIGFVSNRLNIYWVDTVNGGTGNGWSNFGAQIVMGKNSGDELLSHEIGHAFSLTHTNGDANFNVENIMASASNTRQFITEGQLFRAHMNPSSVLNDLYHARFGEITRQCDYASSGPLCPVIHKRIWADGSFPAN
ncbi:MAG: hypothetical protein ABW047_05345 [Nitrospiraceae bacterium]